MAIERIGLELPPKLSLKRVNARSVGEAMDKSRKNGAGQDELEEMYTWLNKNKSSETADSWTPTFNFFPNAGVGEVARSVMKNSGQFWHFSFLRDDGWFSHARAVVKD